MAQIITRADRSEAQTMTTPISSGQKAKRTHYLVAIEKLGIRIGWPCGVVNEGIVDVANAKSIEEAQIIALKRAAKKWKTNPIALRITNVQVVKPLTEVVWDSANVDKSWSLTLQTQAATAHREANRPYVFDATAPKTSGLATLRRN